jgi:exodeoxyribonuclease VII large subunit
MSDLFTTNQEAAGFLDVHAKVKDLSQQVDWIITQRQTNYISELVDLQSHKSVAVRRKVAIGLGLLGTIKLLNEIEKWQLSESDRQTWLILQDSIDKIKRRSQVPELDQSVHVLTVSEAITKIKRIVSDQQYIIEGELADIKLIGPMYYFALKDSYETRLDCQVYSGKVLGFGFPLNEGWAVRAKGKFKIDKFGKLKFEVENLQLTGEGELLRNLQLLESKLESEGLFDPDRKRSINSIPTNILLIASPNSAAIDDFQKVLKARRQNINIYFLPIKTQGVGSELDILQKLSLANHFCKELPIQTIIVTRGGGSKDDLMIFNSEKVVRAIHSLIKPTIVAIGHERDTCLSEKVADQRASTPSNAAELVSLSNMEIKNELDGMQHFWQSYFWQRQSEYSNFGNSINKQIQNLVQSDLNQIKMDCQQVNLILNQLINQLRTGLHQSWRQITWSIQQIIHSEQSRLQYLDNQNNSLKQTIINIKQSTKQNWQEIQQILHLRLQQEIQQINLLDQILEIHNPKKVLAMGYVIVTQKNKSVQKITEFDTQQKTTLQWQDGKIEL